MQTYRQIQPKMNGGLKKTHERIKPNRHNFRMTNSKLPKTILIVEDEGELREILTEILSPICDNILTASNGLDALKVMKSSPEICAILSDISMPKMSGLELLHQIRRDLNPVPFVIITGFGEGKNYQEAIRLNATDFLTKPFDSGTVVEVMERATQYGFEMIQVERKLEQIYRNSNLSEEKISEIKRVKRTVMAMRIESSLYSKIKDD